MNQPDLFGLNWIDANDALPKPGQRVLLITQSSVYGGPIMDISVPVNDCDGNQDNPYYGRVDKGLMYWSEQPLGPVSVLR